jgi:PAS domain S-box-containing protein
MSATDPNSTLAGRSLADLIGLFDGAAYELDGESFAFTYVSPSAEALLGYPLADWYEPGFWQRRVHPEDVVRADAFWLEEAAARRAHVLEYRMVTADRRTIWIHDRATPVERSPGRPGFVGLMFDVTKLKEAEQTVRLMSILTADQVGDAFFQTLVTRLCRELQVRHVVIGAVSDANPARFTTVAAADDGELLDPTLIELGSAPWHNAGPSEVGHVAGGLRSLLPDNPLLEALGAESYLGYPLLGADEQPIGLFALFDPKPFPRSNSIDTVMAMLAARAGAELERRRAERQRQVLQAQLVQAQKMEAIGTLAGGIAHDFNNILMGILGNAEIAQEELYDWHPARANLREILRAAHRARDVVQRILTFSRKREPERKQMTLQPVVDEAAALLRATLPTTIEIRVEPPEHPGYILGDPGQIHQVLMNLAANAAQAMVGQRGVLTFAESLVDVDRALAETYVELKVGRYVLLSVSDNGPGIGEDVLSRIFEPFFTTKPPGEGTGLGLAVVHGIVRDHDGAIVVRSQPEAGTRFDLYFPALAPPEAVAPAAEPAAAPQGVGQHILFIDDEPTIVRVGRRMLERLGYRVTACESARAALDLFDRDPSAFELVISDLTMPELTGLEIADRIRAVNPSVKIVVTTGNVDLLGPDQDRGRIDEVLPKPFATTRLAHIVSRLIGPPNERGGRAYFAYGANLDQGHMARTTPGASLLGRATLFAHKIAIARAGYATLIPSAGDQVEGVLWFLTGDDEAALDRFEKISDGLYRKATATVQTPTGDEVTALVYLANDPSPGVAARGYLDQIKSAAAAHGLSPEYRAGLERLPSSDAETWSGHP